MKILAIDPGKKRIGIAISDSTGTIANPLGVLEHVARTIDAAAIAQLAAQHGAVRIIVGQSLGLDSKPNVAGRSAARLAAAIRTQTDLPVELWDEAFSTQEVRAAQARLGAPRRKQRGHLDELAATYILQTYLDARTTSKD